MTKRKQVFSFEVTEKPALVNVDAEKILLCEKNDNKSANELVFQYHNAKNFMDRFEAVEGLVNHNSAKVKDVYKASLKDPFWVLRGQAIDGIEQTNDSEIINTLLDIAKNDEHSQVRAAAIGKLGEWENKKIIPIAQHAIDTEKSYQVIATALQTLVKLDYSSALIYAQKLEKEENGSIISSLGEMYAENGKTDHLTFFEDNWNKVDGYNAVSFFDNYLLIIMQANTTTVFNSMNKLKNLATNMTQSPWRRLAATKAMNDMRMEYQVQASVANEAQKKSELLANVDKITKMIEEIKAKEDNDQLKGLYNNY